MVIQSKIIIQESKPLFAGIDVGAEELILVIRKNGIPHKAQKFANTPADRVRLMKKLASLPGIIVCMEATGVYHRPIHRPSRCWCGAHGGQSEGFPQLRQGVDENQQDGCR